jgi:hypothetical protein
MSRQRVRLTPEQRQAIKRSHRCPDCHSTVRITKDRHVDVEHDDTCPTLSALRQAGRCHSDIAVVLRDGPAQIFTAGRIGSALTLRRIGETPYASLRYPEHAP